MSTICLQLYCMCVAQEPHNVVRYSIPTNVNPRIREYFGIDAVTGEVFLQKSMLADTQRQKTYGVRARSCRID